MSEPFIRAFVKFARDKFAAWDEEDDNTINSKLDMSKRLQKKYGWTEKEAILKIDKALQEWNR